MKAETMGISDGTWSAVLEGQPLTVTVKDGTVTVTREAHPGADVLNREQAQELLLSPLASKGSKVPSEIWKEHSIRLVPASAVLCDGRRILGNDCWEAEKYERDSETRQKRRKRRNPVSCDFLRPGAGRGVPLPGRIMLPTSSD